MRPKGWLGVGQVKAERQAERGRERAALTGGQHCEGLDKRENMAFSEKRRNFVWPEHGYVGVEVVVNGKG